MLWVRKQEQWNIVVDSFFTASKVKLNILDEVICFANTKCCLNENKLDHAGIKIYTGGILLLSVENNVLVTANGEQ